MRRQPDELIESLRHTVPPELRESIGDALGVDLNDLESPEGVQAFRDSLDRRDLRRVTGILEAGDAWIARRDKRPEPAPKDPRHEALLDKLAGGRSWMRRTLARDLGQRSEEEGRLDKELRDGGMGREEYVLLVHQLGNAVQRYLAAVAGGECPACKQHAVNPASRHLVRWLSTGLVNTCRALVFLVELAIVVWFASLVVMFLARLFGLSATD